MSTLTDDPAFRQGLDLSLQRSYDGAIAAFEDVAARYANEPLAHKELGFAYARRGESILPEPMKQRDTDGAPGGAAQGGGETSVSLRSSLGGVVNAALGLAVLSASKAIGSTDWIVRYRDDFWKASEALERGAKLFDEQGVPDAETYFALAQCLRYLGLTDKARDAAMRATEIAPSDQRYAARARALEMLPEGDGRAGDRERPTWGDLILPARTKRELRQMQLMIEDPKLAVSLGVEPPTGLLLYGLPGTGKTTIARVLASEAKCRFFATSPAEINSMWLGESEKQVKKLFDQARAAAPAIIFLDEIDALLPSRSGGVNMYSDKVVNQFLHEMDGLRANRRIFVVGATNRRDMLDPALLRGGRLSREIEIPLPDLNGRRELLSLYAKSVNLAPEISLDDLAARTDGYSGANIRALINEAGLQALIRLAEARDVASAADAGAAVRGASVSQQDFDEAITNFSQSAAQQPPTDPNPFARMWN